MQSTILNYYVSVIHYCKNISKLRCPVPQVDGSYRRVPGAVHAGLLLPAELARREAGELTAEKLGPSQSTSG